MELNDAIGAANIQIRQLHDRVSHRNALYQHALLDSGRLAKRCQFTGRISAFDENLVLSLWVHGLIDAENLAERSKWLKTEGGKPSWAEILNFNKTNTCAQAPRFHLYRLYPLWRIYRAAKAPLHPIRFPRRDLADAVDAPLHWEHIDGEQTFVYKPKLLNQINLIATLAIVCEPCTFTQITGRVTSSSGPDLYAAQLSRDRFREELEPCLRPIGMDALETIRIALCRAAQQVEPNVRVHKLMRFCTHDFQMNLKGPLFVAVIFNQMAETIRRATERAFNVCLPEEDEAGYLIWNKSARTGIFGTGRPLNAPPRVWKAFLRDLGIDPGIRARVYVEGHTEAGVFEALVGTYAHVEIINLAGRVRQKGPIAFLESLKGDIRKQIFSFVALDSDREDNIRAIRTAAAREEFFGEGYLFEGNIELGAFSSEQKSEAVLQFAKEGGASAGELEEIEKVIDFSDGFEALAQELRVKYHCLRDLKKGTDWGKALASAIVETPFPTEAKELAAEQNPILKATGRILMASRYDYMQSFRDSKVCPETLQLVPR